jgi:hypothetical protein
MAVPNVRGNIGFPKTDPWKTMNLENINKPHNKTENRALNAPAALNNASARVCFEVYFTVNNSIASHQSHILEQVMPATRMERENSGFSM